VETRSDHQAPARGTRSSALRDRRRTRTRLLIQGEALRLFNEKGYAQTTVEEIADASDISPRTFFRYFPTKEDVVIWDEYDPLAADLIEARPKDEPLAETLYAIIREATAGLYRRDPEGLLTRFRLLMTVPELRARFQELQSHGVEQLAPLLSRHRGGGTNELLQRVVGSSLVAAVTVALDLWQQSGGRDDLLALLDRAIHALADSMGELRSGPRSQTTANSPC
jgi:AcrR family transcriptional regulator